MDLYSAEFINRLFNIFEKQKIRSDNMYLDLTKLLNGEPFPDHTSLLHKNTKKHENAPTKNNKDCSDLPFKPNLC